MTEHRIRVQEMFDAFYEALYMLTVTRADAAKHMTAIAIKAVIRSWEEDGSNADSCIVEWWEEALEELDKIKAA